ncbi:radical SAM protein [Verminephrobacter aporrectodeae subsp. tuberculatae]|uniref:B12-binding domain-containing radical SAM protein n=1 Tax=Verminephrobacter aporrectodeae TaxID=1110389 RepID=UPI002237E330|nr:radical SAM protein [Verminephrobacter aporrectodeae]MCW5255582.1 radical SAM protein [Verminephrobacter aporrectodeae subsp. tuberculatae]
MTDAVLIFPPLVDTNFGAYYPSTAVLAGYLQAHGHACRQFDWNEDFAVHLLQPDVLQRIAAGDGMFSHLEDSDPARIAARLLKKLRTFLFDDAGRHDFAQSRFGYLLHDLAACLRIDEQLPALFATSMERWPLHDEYWAFCEQQGRMGGRDIDGKLIGISVPMGPQLAPALILARALADACRGVRIVLGGPAISLMSAPDRHALLKACPQVDALVRYDGEIPLLALVRQHRLGRWAPHEVGSTSALIDAAVVETPPQPGPDLESLPFPCYEGALLARLIKPELGLVQARGCYWGRCSYCDFVELYEGSPSFRTRKAERFVDEMVHQVQVHGASRFTFITEAIPPGFARRVADEIRRRGVRCTWNSFAMVDHHFDDALLREIAESGCEYLCIGMETMTDRVLGLVKKAATQALNVEFLQAARQAGIRLQVNLIPDLPSTTAAEALESLEIFRSLSDCFASVAVFPFEATKSSEIGRHPGKFMLQIAPAETGSGQAQFASNHLDAVDPAMTRQEREEIHRQFRAFAHHHNGAQHPISIELAGADEVTRGNRVRVAWRFLDLHLANNGSLVVFNALNRRSLSLPTRAASLLRAVAESPLTSLGALGAHARSPAEALELLGGLARIGGLATFDCEDDRELVPWRTPADGACA